MDVAVAADAVLVAEDGDMVDTFVEMCGRSSWVRMLLKLK